VAGVDQDMKGTIFRRGPAVALAAAGGLLTAGGVLLVTVPFRHGTVPQWNGVCSSGIGQLGQLFDATAQQDCGLVSLADHLIGWLFAGGALALAASALVWLRSPRAAR
jgi:hypothetical protein